MTARITLAPSAAARILGRKGAPRRSATALLLEQIAEAGLPEPDLEVRFYPGRLWRFDLAWPPWLVAIEIDGGDFGRSVKCHVCNNAVKRKLKSGRLHSVREGGKHANPTGRAKDREKDRAANLLGWTVLRYSPEEIRREVAIADLCRLGAIFDGPARMPMQLRLF